MPVSSALISGGASLVGDFIQGDMARKAAHSAQDFSEQMSNTQYQRAVADLKAAGINPIMAARLGTSTPGGVSYEAPNIGSNLASSINSARSVDAQQQTSDAAKQQAQTQQNVGDSAIGVNQSVSAKTDAEAGLIAEQTNTERHKQAQSDAEASAADAAAALSRATIPKTVAETPNIAADTDLKKQDKVNLQAALSTISAQAAELQTRSEANQATASGTKSENVSRANDAAFIADHPWIAKVGAGLHALGITGGGILSNVSNFGTAKFISGQINKRSGQNYVQRNQSSARAPTLYPDSTN